jgi:hypothetical protein
VPAPAFEYAIVRVIPRVERGEFVNAGVILYCSTEAFLACEFGLDVERLRALDRRVDSTLVQRHLDAFAAVCRGDRDAGPIAALPQRERYHWLVAPRSSVIQVSPVHGGCGDPAAALARVFATCVG